MNPIEVASSLLLLLVFHVSPSMAMDMDEDVEMQIFDKSAKYSNSNRKSNLNFKSDCDDDDSDDHDPSALNRLGIQRSSRLFFSEDDEDSYEGESHLRRKENHSKLGDIDEDFEELEVQGKLHSRDARAIQSALDESSEEENFLETYDDCHCTKKKIIEVSVIMTLGVIISGIIILILIYFDRSSRT